MEKETCIVLILKRAVPLEYVLCWLLKYIKEPKWLILYLCENVFWSRAESNGSAVRMIPALSVNMRLLCFLTQISRGPLCACVCVCGRGRTCICAYMCAEWEQGHSWGLGFLSEKKKKTSSSLFIHLIVKPPLCRSFVSGSRSLPASRSGSFPFVSSCHCLPYVVYLMYIDWFLHDCGSAEPREGVSRNWQGC